MSSFEGGLAAVGGEPPLTSYKVLKHKRGAIAIMGVRVDVLGLFICGGFLIAFFLEVWVGVAVTVVTGFFAFAISRGRFPGWMTYARIYWLRRRTVLVAATPTSGIWEEALRALSKDSGS